jgi:hypothetical protein
MKTKAVCWMINKIKLLAFKISLFGSTIVNYLRDNIKRFLDTYFTIIVFLYKKKQEMYK